MSTRNVGQTDAGNVTLEQMMQAMLANQEAISARLTALETAGVPTMTAPSEPQPEPEPEPVDPFDIVHFHVPEGDDEALVIVNGPVTWVVEKSSYDRKLKRTVCMGWVGDSNDATRKGRSWKTFSLPQHTLALILGQPVEPAVDVPQMAVKPRTDSKPNAYDAKRDGIDWTAQMDAALKMYPRATHIGYSRSKLNIYVWQGNTRFHLNAQTLASRKADGYPANDSAVQWRDKGDKVIYTIAQFKAL